MPAKRPWRQLGESKSTSRGAPRWRRAWPCWSSSGPCLQAATNAATGGRPCPGARKASRKFVVSRRRAHN